MQDPQERATCVGEAESELSNALSACDTELDARLQICNTDVAYPDSDIDPGRFVDVVDNPYFLLPRGVTFVYLAQTDAGVKRIDYSVTGDTYTVLGVDCTVVHETERLDGALTSTSDEWFAQDVDGDVWCFGEQSFEFKGDRLVGAVGWEAGRDGARATIRMKASPQVAELYYHQFAPARGEEIAEVVDVDASVTIDSGTFTDCLKIAEFNLLEPGRFDYKYYAPGVGLIFEEDHEDDDDGDAATDADTDDNYEQRVLVDVFQDPSTDR